MRSDMTHVIQGFTQFYLTPNTSHTCLHSPPAEEHRHPLAGNHRTYPWMDGQAEFTNYFTGRGSLREFWFPVQYFFITQTLYIFLSYDWLLWLNFLIPNLVIAAILCYILVTPKRQISFKRALLYCAVKHWAEFRILWTLVALQKLRLTLQ